MVVPVQIRPASWREPKGSNFDNPPKHVEPELERKRREVEAADARLENHLRETDCADCGKAFDKPQHRCDDCKEQNHGK